jgi:inosine/xanthosine triphosphatase
MKAFKPRGYNSLSPYLVVEEAQSLIDFLQKIFTIIELRKDHYPSGLIAHAEIQIDDTILMLCDEQESKLKRHSSIHVYVENVDETYVKAVNAGANKAIKPKAQNLDEDRQGSFVDIAGNQWSISTQKPTFKAKKNIVVASLNPVKIQAAKRGFERMFKESSFEVTGISVPSNVSDQPMTSKETLKGALNRAKNAQKEIIQADYWVGIEGGIEIVNDQMQVFAWIVVLSSQMLGKAQTSVFYLPNRIKELVESGIELGHADDMVFNRENSKQGNGAVGILTNDLIDRTDYYIEAVILALIPFVNKKLYAKTKT